MRLSDLASKLLFSIFNRYALGADAGAGKIHVCGNRNIGWNTMLDSFSEGMESSYNIEIRTLSDFFTENFIGEISLLKIDVEGYEYPVLKGMKGYLDAHPDVRPPILVEIFPGAPEALGYRIADMQEYMESFGYICISDHKRRAVRLDEIERTSNVLFIQEEQDGSCEDR